MINKIKKILMIIVGIIILHCSNANSNLRYPAYISSIEDTDQTIEKNKTITEKQCLLISNGDKKGYFSLANFKNQLEKNFSQIRKIDFSMEESYEFYYMRLYHKVCLTISLTY